MAMMSRMICVALLATLSLTLSCGRLSTEPEDLLPVRIIYSENLDFHLDRGGTETINSQQRWQQVWNEIHPGDLAGPLLPVVDFSRESVLWIAQGRQLTGCLSYRIRQAVRDGRHVVIDVREQRPGPECVCVDRADFVLLAAIPVPNAQTEFRISTELHCD
jgi:hypothetical protein